MNKKVYKQIKQMRCVHLIDIENLCGASNPTLEQVVHARQVYFADLQPGKDDIFYVTVSSKANLAAAAYGWPGASYESKDGHDGADILLAKHIAEDRLQDRFREVFVASGDGGLSPFVEHLVNAGEPVTVVSDQRFISMKLRLSGAKVRYVRSGYQLAA